MIPWFTLAVLTTVTTLGDPQLHSATTGAKLTIEQALMRRLQHLLEDDKFLAFQKVDCAKVYENQFGAQNACYGTQITTERVVLRIQKRLDQIAYSGGWRNDYGIWGSFYEVRAPSKWTFGITVSPVKGDIELEAVQEIRRYKNFITVTVDRRK